MGIGLYQWKPEGVYDLIKTNKKAIATGAAGGLVAAKEYLSSFARKFRKG